MRELLSQPGIRDLAIVVADRTDMLLAIIDDGIIRWRSDIGARYLLGCPGGIREIPLADILEEDDLRRLQTAGDGPIVVHARRWDNHKPVALRTIAWPVSGASVVVAVAAHPTEHGRPNAAPDA